MRIDKYLICDCGKKKRIHWSELAEFKRGESSFTYGASECSKCGVVQSHYTGNALDIAEFVSYLETQYDEPTVH